MSTTVTNNDDMQFLNTEKANLSTAMDTQNRQLFLYENVIEQSYVYMYILLSIDGFLLIALFALSLQSRGFFSRDSALKLIFFFFLLSLAVVLYFIQVLRWRKNTEFEQINLQDPQLAPNNTQSNQTSLRKSGRLLAATSQTPPCVDEACCPGDGSSGNPYWSHVTNTCILPTL